MSIIQPNPTHAKQTYELKFEAILQYCALEIGGSVKFFGFLKAKKWKKVSVNSLSFQVNYVNVDLIV